MRAPSGISSPFEAARVALAVPPLVVAENQRRHGIRKRHAADDLGADLRVDADLLEFLLRERPGLRQDVLGHGQLADVVQQRRRLHALNLVVAHAERAREAGGVHLNAPDVALRRLILGVDGERQRFDRGQVEIRDLPHVPLLILNPAHVDLVGPVDQVDAAPPSAAPSSSRRASTTAAAIAAAPRAEEVARRAPEEVLVPDAERRLAGRQARSRSR